MVCPIGPINQFILSRLVDSIPTRTRIRKCHSFHSLVAYESASGLTNKVQMVSHHSNWTRLRVYFVYACLSIAPYHSTRIWFKSCWCSTSASWLCFSSYTVICIFRLKIQTNTKYIVCWFSFIPIPMCASYTIDNWTVFVCTSELSAIKCFFSLNFIELNSILSLLVCTCFNDIILDWKIGDGESDCFVFVL